ncbi:MAG: sialate O-acetylesterase [Cyclobacteriaceae bacterium]
MKRIGLLALTLHLLLCTYTKADIRLPEIIGDHMVLQRESSIKVWGWGEVGEEVNVRFQKKRYRAEVGENGMWSVNIATGKAGGPYNMRIEGRDNTIEIRDILLGDVWLCSGQSNMVHNLGRHQDRYQEEIANADYPEIRQIIIPDQPVLAGPSAEIRQTEWQVAKPETILDFTVVGYFFAKHIYDRHKVPIGLIKSCVGGTPIQAWISEEGLQDFPDMMATIRQNKDTAYLNEINRRVKANAASAEAPPQDQGLVGEIPWYDPDYLPEGWMRMNIPGYWEDQGIRDLNGTVWFRKEIDVPASMTGKPARIDMGRIVDADNIYINGQKVGSTGYQYPQRRYHFEAGILKEGRNTIVVQVINYGGKGGFVPDKPYYLAAGSDTIDLKGYWLYKVGNVFKPQRGNFSGGISRQNQPSSLYNGMIAPFKDYKVRGVLWYQGESNAGRGDDYDELMKALIHDWRQQLGSAQLPLLYVQLPNFMDVNYLPEESAWAELRFAQLEALELENTAMVVTLNLGEWNDIHPGNKKPIGDRLALAARHMVYGEENLVYSGPIYKSAQKEGHKVVISFDHVGSGLVANDGKEVRWLAVAGLNKEFVWAQSEIKDNKLIVWSDEVADPAYVRYAWMDNPQQANLFNEEGLPASPFEAVLYPQEALWKGKKAAVVLTYDDALEVHLDHVVPALDAHGFRATFYLTGAFSGMSSRLDDWKRVAKRHELGNHSLYHPCDAEGKDWVTPANDLSRYTTTQMKREVAMMNILLRSLDGKNERTFAYPCGETSTGEGSFMSEIHDQFVAMRGVNGQINTINQVDLSNINSFVADGKKASDFVEWAEKARQQNGMMVILFHGVGGGHPGNVELEEHQKFLQYLKENQEDFWITTMLDASQHIKNYLEK